MQSNYQPLRAWFITSMLLVLMAINFVDKVALGLVASQLMKELSLSPAQYGLLASSFFLLFPVTCIAGGFLANRLSTRWLLVAMSVLWALVQLPIAFSSSLAVLIVSRVLLGASEGPAQPIAIHACYKWFPDERRNLPVSVFQQGGVLGMVGASLLIPIVNETWGWRSNFLLLGGVGLAWAVLWLCFGREGTLDAQGLRLVPQAVNLSQATPAPLKRFPYRTLLTDRTVVCTIALHFAATLSFALGLTWLPTYLSQGLGYSPRHAGQLFACMLLAIALVSLALSAWSQRMMVRGVPSHIARGGFTCSCLAIGGVVFVAAATLTLGPGWKAALIAIAISMTPIIYSLGPAIVAQITPPAQRSAVLSIEYSIAWIAGVIAPTAVGWMIRAAHNNIAIGFEHGLLANGLLLVILGVWGLKVLNPERSIVRLASRNAT